MIPKDIINLNKRELLINKRKSTKQAKKTIKIFTKKTRIYGFRFYFSVSNCFSKK